MIAPDNTTIGLDGHVRPFPSLKSMHGELCAVLFFVSSSTLIKYMILFLQQLCMSGARSNNVSIRIQRCTGLFDGISFRLLQWYLNKHLLIQTIWFSKHQFMLFSDCSIIEWTSSKKDLHNILSWLPSTFVHDWVTSLRNNARSSHAKVDTSKARWLRLKNLIKLNRYSMRFIICSADKNKFKFLLDEYVCY